MVLIRGEATQKNAKRNVEKLDSLLVITTPERIVLLQRRCSYANYLH